MYIKCDDYAIFAYGNEPDFDGKLELGHRSIKSIKEITYLPITLEELHLVENKIKRIEGLESCPYLTELWLNNNEISRIEGLDHCKHLKLLDLRHNRIKKLEGLQNCAELEILMLDGNEISKEEMRIASNPWEAVKYCARNKPTWQRIRVAEFKKLDNFL